MSHVLVIDDSSTTRLYYRDNLEQAGFTVDEAINGIEGLEKSMSQSFDLILVDINMPKMDGYTFMNQLRRSSELRSVPAIMISTQAREADRTKAYAAGANVYIVKPVDPVELVAYGQLLTGQGTSRKIST
jgi:two-component system chemotaxis response regulator CheY